MAGRIPQDFLDQLLDRTDIVELIDSRVSLRKSGRNYSACCPFHNEKTPSFTVSPDKQFYHCFGCGAHGSAISFLMDYERFEFREAVEELARSCGLELPSGIAAPQSAPIQRQLGEWLSLAERFYRYQLRHHPQRQRAIEYLRGRGLDGTIAKTFGVGYAPPGWDNLLQALTVKGAQQADLIESGLVIERDGGGVYDRFRDRIMYPIRNHRGDTIGFGGRALDDTPPKYLNSPETPLFHKGKELYGLYEARQQRRQPSRLLIVEGYMDVLALAQHRIPYAVATLGTATTGEHLERLFRVTHELIFCFDGDRAGREAAWRALQATLSLLRDGRQVSYLFLPEGEDPDSLIRAEGTERFSQRLETAEPLTDYFLRYFTEQTDTTRLDGRARLVELAKPLLDTMPDSLVRDMMLQRLANSAQVPAERLVMRTSIRSASQSLVDTKRLVSTPPRYAIALLLRDPSLAQQAGALGALQQTSDPGPQLLVKLLEIIEENPHITAAKLIERYRDSDTGRILTQLAQWEPILGESSEADFSKEFIDVMERLRQRYDSDQLLLDKSAHLTRPSELDPAERERLRRLGKQHGSKENSH